MPGPDTLFISLADFGSLAAMSLEEAPEKSLVWRPTLGDGHDDDRSRAVSAQAHAYGITQIVEAPLQPLLTATIDPDWPDDLGVLLLAAAREARARGCRRVVWTGHHGRAFESFSRSCETIMLVNEVLAQAGGLTTAPIEAPLLESTDAQVVELADRGVAPLESAWWRRDCPGVSPCGGCKDCNRWLEAFEAARVVWPWPIAMSATGA
ncbi:MAG: 7-cyano-7-deazaguanine synthase [Phycisphaerales bacterium]